MQKQDRKATKYNLKVEREQCFPKKQPYSFRIRKECWRKLESTIFPDCLEFKTHNIDSGFRIQEKSHNITETSREKEKAVTEYILVRKDIISANVTEFTRAKDHHLCKLPFSTTVTG